MPASPPNRNLAAYGITFAGMVMFVDVALSVETSFYQKIKNI